VRHGLQVAASTHPAAGRLDPEGWQGLRCFNCERLSTGSKAAPRD